MYQVKKIIKGFSTCFRQWKAKDTHCSQLHGYAIQFELTFASDGLDHRNWVIDFGIFSRSDFKFDGIPIKEWFKYMFDHTTVMSIDDPALPMFLDLQEKGIVNLRTLDNVGCEKFAELVFSVISLMISHDFKNKQSKPKLISVKCIENENNSAIYYGK